MGNLEIRPLSSCERFRGKLDAVAPEWAWLHTRFGIGYRLSPEPAVP